jgi:hypothetical protein
VLGSAEYGEHEWCFSRITSDFILAYCCFSDSRRGPDGCFGEGGGCQWIPFPLQGYPSMGFCPCLLYPTLIARCGKYDPLVTCRGAGWSNRLLHFGQISKGGEGQGL